VVKTGSLHYNFIQKMIETTRLRARPIVDSDFPNVFRIQSDPEIMHHIRPAVDDPEIVRGRMAYWMKYTAEQPGLGVFALEWKDTGAFAGYAVARHVDYNPATGEFEVGYIIARECWGLGLATEVTRALCVYLFESFQPAYIVAFTAHENSASQHVLLKSGFTAYGTRDIYEGGSKEFRISRPEASNVKF
jgi:RimJ/RimL family protein N-acetyltransferase